MLLAHPKADICSLVAQSNKGTMSLSHLTVLKSSFFLWGSLAWCKDSKPSFSTMNTTMLRASLRTVCRWTSALSPTRDVLLSVDCVARHQQGPWEEASSERALSNRYMLIQDIGVKTSLISIQRATSESCVIPPEKIPALAATRGCYISYRSHGRVFSPEHPPNRVTKSLLLATDLSQHAVSPKLQAKVFLDTPFPVQYVRMHPPQSCSPLWMNQQ